MSLSYLVGWSILPEKETLLFCLQDENLATIDLGISEEEDPFILSM